jgi:hypothetical protein
MDNLPNLMNFTRHLRMCLIAVFSMVLSLPTFGIIDFDDDSISDFWSALNPGVSAGPEDSDGDGYSNHEEMVAGTDPQDGASFVTIESIEGMGFVYVVRWEGVAGKAYTVEKFVDGIWEPIVTNILSMTSGPNSVNIVRGNSRGVIRLTVSDIDEDGDGINAWEESLLGWDDSTAYGSGSETAQDYEQVIRLAEAPEGITLADGIVLPQRLPTQEEASRFLMQATYGPTMESIEEVSDEGLISWLDQQMNPLITRPTLTSITMFLSGQEHSRSLWRHGWWHNAVTRPDQLRQRMAYALSQILVINTEGGNIIGDNITIQSNYYDPLIKNAFNSYRGVLDHVAYSPAMGYYLSHMRNRKSAPEINRFPDENFAREIMQLFSIGLWELNPDGSRKINGEGDFIPTYDNATITELAKMFTGMSPILSLGKAATSFYDPINGNDYTSPMRVWDEEHELGEKILFGEVVIPAGQTGEEDVQMALDILSEHSSAAPFLSRFFFQRFTS